MTEEYQFIPDDTLWEQEEEVVESGGNTRFARAKLFYPVYVNRFQAGQHFKLPGVFYDEYDAATQSSVRVGQKEFRGMTIAKGGKHYMAIFVLEQQDKNGNWYQRQMQFGNWKDKDDTGCAWVEFQKNELMKLSKEDRTKLTAAAANNTWTYIQYTEGETGYKGEYERKKYLADIKVYASEAEWNEASKAFFAQFGGNGTGPADDYYPAVWGNSDSINQMIEYGKGLKDSKEPAEIAIELQLYDGNEPSVTRNGQPCNVVKIMSEVLEVPEPMVKL